VTGRNGYWKRHPNKDLQLFLYEMHLNGWRIENPPKYYKALCACPDKHRTYSPYHSQREVLFEEQKTTPRERNMFQKTRKEITWQPYR